MKSVSTRPENDMQEFWFFCAGIVFVYLTYDTIKNDPHCKWFKK